jgi:hypothetical protein
MSKPIVAIITFVVSTAIVLGILQYIVHLQGSILKLVIGVVIGLIAAGIAFLVVKEPVKS